MDRHQGLYPDLRNETDSYKKSSAPLIEESYTPSNGLSYPPSDDGVWKSTYKSDFVSPRPPINRHSNSDAMHSNDSSRQNPSNGDELRRARLRRFDKK